MMLYSMYLTYAAFALYSNLKIMVSVEFWGFGLFKFPGWGLEVKHGYGILFIVMFNLSFY